MIPDAEKPKIPKTKPKKPNRAKTYEELKPLLELCKAGRLFDVQSWIAAGRPVNPPKDDGKGQRPKPPLAVAVEKGFHSLVQVLLEASAEIHSDRYDALLHAVLDRRFDLIELLVTHGADIQSVDMLTVFESWQPEIIDFFIEHGADVETGNPLAAALCHRIRTTLGVYKRYQGRFLSFQEQANMALRHHCHEGNVKWASLVLWLGADPFAPGLQDAWSEPDPDEEGMCALELAVWKGHTEILKLKKIKLDPAHPVAEKLIAEACFGSRADVLQYLLDFGIKPFSAHRVGTRFFNSCLLRLDWSSWRDAVELGLDLDFGSSRDGIKMIHLLALHGAKWLPEKKHEIVDARRSLLKVSADYTLEFIWIMGRYRACKRESVDELIRTPAMKRLLSDHQEKLSQILRLFESGSAAAAS